MAAAYPRWLVPQQYNCFHGMAKDWMKTAAYGPELIIFLLSDFIVDEKLLPAGIPIPIVPE